MKFFAWNLHLNLTFKIKVNKHVFLNIHETFQHKKGTNMSIWVASDPDPKPDPVPNSGSDQKGTIRIRSTDFNHDFHTKNDQTTPLFTNTLQKENYKRLLNISCCFRCTRRARTWRRTSARTLARSRTRARGLAAAGDSRAPTSWRATIASTPAASPSSATSAIELLPAVITSHCIWKDTRDT
jgi:hypothetical protein